MMYKPGFVHCRQMKPKNAGHDLERLDLSYNVHLHFFAALTVICWDRNQSEVLKRKFCSCIIHALV